MKTNNFNLSQKINHNGMIYRGDVKKGMQILKELILIHFGHSEKFEEEFKQLIGEYLT